jgi:NADH-quinone oxidoreductase subunit E
MNNSTLGLSFWLALAAGVLVFGVTLVLGGYVWWLAALFGAVVFAVLLAVLTYAFTGKTDAAAAPKVEAAKPAQPAAAVEAAAETAPAQTAPKAVAKPAKSESAAKPAAKAAAKPAAKAPAKAAEKPAAKAAEAALGTVGTAPSTLSAPRDGRADDLKILEGVGPAMEKLVNSLGFYHFDQIANWTAEEVAWVDSHMKTFRGRIVRDKWQAQAKIILAEGIPAFLERAKTNNY